MILLAGPPGAGKSMQAGIVQDRCSYQWVSMGKLLRRELDESVQHKLRLGEMIDDETTFEILEKAILDVPAEKRIILDGFPRRDSQVTWFLKFIEKDHRDLRAVIHLKVSEEESVNRLMQRGRQDDQEAVVRNRYQLYLSEIVPMIRHLKNRSYPVIEINGEQSVENVSTDIMKEIEC